MNYRTPLVLLMVSALLGACSDKTTPASADMAADVVADVPAAAADTASAEHLPPPAASAPKTEEMNTPQARKRASAKRA